MPLNAAFLSETEPLRVPGLGTELMAPLLYSLVRSLRPQRVLEVGMGYTSPFLLRALADNADDFTREREALREKSARYLGDGGADEDADYRWLAEYPELALPAHYRQPHAPLLHAVDDLSLADTSAPKVLGVVERLGLSHLLRVHDGDFRHAVGELRERCDFVWFDCGGRAEYRDFLDRYWDTISDDNGVLVLHLTLTNLPIGSLVKELKLRQATTEFHDFELVSLLEPHKLTQNSFTIVRKTRGFREPLYDELLFNRRGQLQDEARLFLDGVASERPRARNRPAARTIAPKRRSTRPRKRSR